MDSVIPELNDKRWIEKEYHENNLSMSEIAEKIGTTKQSVRRAIIRHGIKPKTRAEAQAAALKAGRAKHPTIGTKRPEDVRLRISEAIAKDWAESDEEKLENRSNKSKEHWASLPQHKKDEILKLARDGARLAAKEGSKVEKFLRDGLTKAGFRVEYHMVGMIANQKLEIDMMIPDLSVAIEVDGPSHFLPIWGAENLQKNIKSDIEKNGLLLNQGFAIIRIKQISNNVSNIQQRRILAEVIRKLEEIEKKFPEPDDRLIEIEV